MGDGLKKGESITRMALLPHVIEKVADEEVERLCKGAHRSETGKRIEHALSELRKLQKGESPDYDDEWVVLLYLTWYWIRQFNLCHELFKEAMADLSPGDRLHVVDFGSGPLTAQFAALLAFGGSGARVFFDSFDNSKAMLGIGNRIWKHVFRRINATETASHWKGQRTGDSLIGLKLRIGKYPPWEDGSGHRRILTAFHVFYESTQEHVRRDLATLKEVFRPDMYIATTTGKGDVMARVSPFGPVFSVHPKKRPPQNLLLPSDRIREWRRVLSERFDLGDSAKQDFRSRVPMWESKWPPDVLIHKV